MERANSIEALHQITPEEYPVLHKALYSYKGALLHRLEQLIQLGENFPKWEWYPASVDKLIEKYSGSAATWQSNREYLAAIGLIKVRKPGKDTESKALQESARRAKEGRRAVNWYAIPDYTPDLFKTAEQAAERFKAKGINRKGLTKQGLIIAVGQAQANKAVIDWRSRSKQDKAAEREIIRQIKMAISRKGYAMKENILKRSAKRTATANKVDFVEALYYVRNLWANRNKRLLSMAGARYHRPTRTEKERFNLKGDNWIITVEGEVF